MVTASALSLSSAYSFRFFTLLIHFFHLKPSLCKGPLTLNFTKEIINQILGYSSFCFEISAYLGQLFASTPKTIKFNRRSCSKNEQNAKQNHTIIEKISFCARNAIKIETKNVNKNSLFYSIFVIFLIFWPLELRK